MTHLATISSKFQISLPKALRDRLGLKPGDHLVVEEQDGNLVLTPAATVPKGQLFFWSRRWQEGEAKAESDIAAGRVSRAYSPEEIEKMTTDMLKAPASDASRRKKP
ncbi:MAG: AbrB/MazE/SpoVT family DNA-binding domain-containing protein [Acidobacteriota bacterium]